MARVARQFLAAIVDAQFGIAVAAVAAVFGRGQCTVRGKGGDIGAQTGNRGVVNPREFGDDLIG
jgi:hypothetical protein